VFQIDVTVCADPACGGKAAIIAWITEPDVIDRILRHLGIEPTAPVTAPARAPPQSSSGRTRPLSDSRGRATRSAAPRRLAAVFEAIRNKMNQG
jgi:hypothetical protein